jgi:hypothetical protein
MSNSVKRTFKILARFEVFVLVTSVNTVFWNMTLFSLVEVHQSEHG